MGSYKQLSDTINLINQVLIDIFYVECKDCFSLMHRGEICECCLIHGTGCAEPVGFLSSMEYKECTCDYTKTSGCLGRGDDIYRVIDEVEPISCGLIMNTLETDLPEIERIYDRVGAWSVEGAKYSDLD